MNKFKNCLLCVLLFLCCVLSFYITNEIQFWYSTISLRYNSPLSEQQVNKARDFADSDDNKQNIFPTFWVQQSGTIKTGNSSTQTINIAYLGDGNLAYHSNFISGWYPGDKDLEGCAVSDTLAWNLWGSLDVNGQKLSYSEHSYTVRGVFRDNKSIILTGANANAGFMTVELYGESDSDSHETATTFAMKSNLGTPHQIAYGPSIVGLARMVCFIPILITTILLLIMLWNISHSFKKSTQQIIWFSLALAATILLPYLLSKIPDWMIPSMWSDFSFWGRLLQMIKSRVEGWFLLVPTVKDVAVKFLLLFQLVILFIEIPLIYGIFKRNSRVIINKDKRI